MMTISQASRRTGISKDTIRKLILNGQIQATKVEHHGPTKFKYLIACGTDALCAAAGRAPLDDTRRGLSRKEAAFRVGCSEHTIGALLTAGKLKARRLQMSNSPTGYRWEIDHTASEIAGIVRKEFPRAMTKPKAVTTGPIASAAELPQLPKLQDGNGLAGAFAQFSTWLALSPEKRAILMQLSNLSLADLLVLESLVKTSL